jgi:hypothetical protein
LAAQGLSPEAIAARLKVSISEVELIIAIQDKSPSSPGSNVHRENPCGSVMPHQKIELVRGVDIFL